MSIEFYQRQGLPRLEVLGESTDWIAVNKPAGLPVHPSKPGGPLTLWHGLRELLAYELANGGQVSIINRLDRETSGVTLIAKTSAAARHFAELMQQRAIEKEYLAIAHGWPAWNETTLEAPLTRKGNHEVSAIYLKQAVHPSGASARTRFVVERRFRVAAQNEAPLCVLRAFPETGRMHQIRVHAAQLGHPLVGDKIYGDDETCYLRFIDTGWTPALAAQLWLPRHALHAVAMRIPSEQLHWVAPLPGDLADFLRASGIEHSADGC